MSCVLTGARSSEWTILLLLLMRPFRCRQCSARHVTFFAGGDQIMARPRPPKLLARVIRSPSKNSSARMRFVVNLQQLPDRGMRVTLRRGERRVSQ